MVVHLLGRLATPAPAIVTPHQMPHATLMLSDIPVILTPQAARAPTTEKDPIMKTLRRLNAFFTELPQA
jgi:hypothetical protein